jgi:tetratricopeptide (TPR) repeat protein
MTPAGDEAARRFVKDLYRLRRDAGMPSYSTLERLSDHRLSRSTVSDVLTGKRVRLPEWRFVAAFVATCRNAAAESDLDPAELGTPADWKRRWDAAAAGYTDVPYPGHGEAAHRGPGAQEALDTARFPGTAPPSPALFPGTAPPSPALFPDTAPVSGPVSPGTAPASGPVSPDIAPPSGPVSPGTAPPSPALFPDTAPPSRAPVTDPPPPAAQGRPAAPASATVWGPVPQGVYRFVGRQTALDRLYGSLAGHAGGGTVAIQGLGGIGKTQLAIAYAKRFADHYDLVWWVAGDRRELACAGLAALDVGDTPDVPPDDHVTTVVEALRRGRPYARWLLVFDNADDPDDVRDLMPSGIGDIIVTTRNTRWNAFEELLELDVLSRRESVEFLRHRMRGLTEADAQRLAEAAGDLPLVLEHAAESRIPVDEYLARLEGAPRSLLSTNQPSGYPVPVTESWDTAIERLRAEAPAALDLLQCCAFFGTGPIPLESLERGRYIPESSLHRTLLDPILRSRAIGALGQTALARVDSARRTIQVHRVVQSVIRDRLTAHDAERSRHDVHLLLAAADPGDPDDFDNWPRYEELRGHVTPSDAEGCRDTTVRRLVLNLVRYLRVVGDPVHARTLADRALDRWPATDTDEHALTMNLAISRSKADALRALGSYHEAFELSRTTLDRMRAALGEEHEETIMLGRAVGAEHRMRGRFAQALEADRISVAAHLRVLDRDHPQTFMAVNNLAVDLALNGRYEDAVREDEKVYRDCLTFYGRSDHPAVLVYQNAMARSMRQAGRYRAALQVAGQVNAGYRSVIGRGILGEDHPWVLTHANDLAAARRDAGEPNPHQLASDVHNRCWRAFGVDHPQTLAAAVTLGSVLRGAARATEALDALTDAMRRYRATLGEDHPFTHACAASAAAARRQGGDPVEAIGMVDEALRGLRRTVGGDHHYTLIAMMVHANALADAGDAAAAVAVGREALDGLERTLGHDHPHTLACAANLTLALSDLGRDEEAGTMRADIIVRCQRSLGERHPDVSLILARRRLDVDFSPVPI